jgi:hypothetical protein
VQIVPLFRAKFEDACESGLGKPDVTITRKRDEKIEKRVVYIKKQVVSDGPNCADISGKGLFELPLHRNWFTGQNSVAIALNNSFSVWQNDKMLMSFKKADGEWQNEDPKFFTNWGFFENFIAAAKNIAIDYRAQSDLVGAIAKTCPRGVDVFIDNTAGAIHEAVMQNLATHARVVLVGSISLAGKFGQPDIGPRFHRQTLIARATIQGFLVSDYSQEQQTEARLRKAHALLSDAANAQLSTAEIGFAAGFRETSTFYRRFRRRFGVTPGEMRERN